MRRPRPTKRAALQRTPKESAPPSLREGVPGSLPPQPLPPRGRGRLRWSRSRHELGARELLLRLYQRRDVLLAVTERAGEDERLVHRFADDGRDREAFGEMRVVADVLPRVVELELERAEVAGERLRHHLEDARVDGAHRDDFDQLPRVDSGALPDRERL